MWSVEHEIRAADLGDRVHLVNETPDAASYLAAFDVFALTSREDPFPLVALEASALGTPVVAFDNGGIRELITADCGRIVPYLDVEAMAEAIVDLVEHPDTRRALGEAAAGVVSARHDVAVGAAQLWSDVSERARHRPKAVGRPKRAWWESKASAILFAAYATIAISAPSPHEVFGAVAALLVSAGLLGAYAHVVDDSFDVVADIAAGKSNSVATLGPATRVALAIGLAVAGLAPWALISPGAGGWGVLAVILLLPVAYAAPPLRLKERGAIGLVADATMAHVAPAAFAVALFAHRTSTSVASVWPLALALLVWSLARGVRAILVHQLQDQDNDRAGTLRTFVTERGDERALRLVTHVFFPLEVAGLGALTLLGAARSLLIPVFVVAYAIVWTMARRFWTLPFAPAPSRYRTGRMALERFSVVWPPLIVGCLLVTQSRGYLVFMISPAALFRRSFAQEMQAIGSRFVPFLWQVFARGRRLALPDGR